jgi:hypothetical protein
MKMTAFWDIAPCSLEVDWCSRGVYCLHCPDDGGTLHTSATLVYFNETAWHTIPESCHLYSAHIRIPTTNYTLIDAESTGAI